MGEIRSSLSAHSLWNLMAAWQWSWLGKVPSFFLLSSDFHVTLFLNFPQEVQARQEEELGALWAELGQLEAEIAGLGGEVKTLELGLVQVRGWEAKGGGWF